ncbi:transcription termination/antitermination protein NusA [Candidatus Microgenomates bacterium]|nr:MAG: transcription termination/antitermination protein NusA [Candidatus Microgenomates bacterium]
MPAIVRSEFALALNQVATERGIDPTVVIETIKAAILAAYRKDYGTSIEELEELSVELNPDNGEAKILKDKKDITPPGFGRIAAQTAKQVILQRIREAEKQAILTDYSSKVGTIVNGMVLRFDGSNVIVDIGRAQGVMPPQEQSSGERYRLNQRLTFYIEGIHETFRGNEIIVSRAHKGLVIGLFNREVPEVAQGAVEIKEVAREAGNRSKVAVSSTQSGVDPVGSCVGQKGVRVQAVINELGGSEKIDIIQWSDNPSQFITAALAPAKDISVKLNEENKTVEAFVPEDQLSLAIGKDGQNVRLAARLVGWKIDLKSKTPKEVPAQVAEAPAESKQTVAVQEEAKPAPVQDLGEAKPSSVQESGEVKPAENMPPAAEKTEATSKTPKKEQKAPQEKTADSVPPEVATTQTPVTQPVADDTTTKAQEEINKAVVQAVSDPAISEELKAEEKTAAKPIEPSKPEPDQNAEKNHE